MCSLKEKQRNQGELTHKEKNSEGKFKRHSDLLTSHRIILLYFVLKRTLFAFFINFLSIYPTS